MADSDRAFEERLLKAAQADLPVTQRPFAEVARKHGIEEEELLPALREWMRSGVIRRYGALVSHRKLGYESNAMVVWQVPPERVEQVGDLFAADSDVTHCYERPVAPGLPYNLYTMIHAHTEDECRRKAANLAEVGGVFTYEVLISTREFKKSSPVYGRLPQPGRDNQGVESSE
ncbi:MAG: Lrp/AsnC family transcriptional regulator [Armatimonadota bacterium]|nr:MAG: Lrp/AsnC family transcriptional regulator [Armatimonadota bacterium]